MYQNMDCVVWGNPQFLYSTKYDVYNSANEKIENPVYIMAGVDKIGVMVPYGGYIDVQMDSAHGLDVSIAGGDPTSSLFLSLSIGKSIKFKVVRDYFTRATTANTRSTDKQIV